MKAKKIVISLGIALTAALAVIVGVLMFNQGGKTEPVRRYRFLRRRLHGRERKDTRPRKKGAHACP